MKKITLLGAIFFLIVQLSFSQDTQTSKKISILNPTQDVLLKIKKSGIDLTCGGKFVNNNLELELTYKEIQDIKKLNINYNVIIDDLSAYYKRRNDIELPKAKSELDLLKAQSLSQKTLSVKDLIIDNPAQYDECSEINWAVPQNFKLGSMGGGLTLQETLDELALMQEKYPNIISVIKDASSTNQTTHGNTTGTTWAGQTIYYVRISDNPDIDEANEPETLITGAMHAREISSVMNTIYFMWYILENYDRDPYIKNIVDNQEIYVMPISNPDGYLWNEIIQPSGGGLQRKNLRPGTADNGTTNTNNNVRGVDLNRNFNYYWGWDNTGSSPTASSNTYRGPSAGSEPETQIVQDFILNHDIKVAVNHHGGLNSIVTSSYNGDASATDSGREDEYAKICHDLTQYNRYIYGSAPNTLYEANGDVNDWMLGGPLVAGNSGSGKDVLAFAPENGDDFWPTPTLITEIARRALRMNLLSVMHSGKFAKLHDLNPSNINTLSGNLEFGIEYLGKTYNDITLTVTPVSNISSLTSPAVQTSWTKLEQRNLSVPFVLNGGIQPNDEIEFQVTLSNDDFIIYRANIVKYYQPTVIFEDNPDTDGLSNWNVSGTTSGGSWSTTTLDAYSGSTAITSTPSGTYSNNEEKYLTLDTATNPINLSSSNAVVIQFYTKWDLERNFDLVQLEASTNGSTWTALCGRYNKPAATSLTNFHLTKSTQTFQSSNGTTVYDGDSMDKWVMEEIYINDANNSAFLGEGNVRLRFKFATDADNREDDLTTGFDGFYFDDFKVISLDSNLGQTISFEPIHDKFTISPDFTVNATSDSGLPITYTIVSGPATIIGNTISLTGAVGTVVVQASQAGDSNYLAAANVTESFEVTEVVCTGTTISTFPYSESFETNLGDWSQGTSDEIDWTRFSGLTPSNTGGNPANTTGPSTASDGTFYLYTESSGTANNKIAYLLSPCFDLSGYENAQLEFDFHMFGTNMGTLSLEVSTDNGTNYTPLFSRTGNHPTQNANADSWITEPIDLSAYNGQTIKLRFHGLTGSDYTSDISIDNINLTADVAGGFTPIASCQNINAILDATGNITIVAADVDSGSSVGDLSIDISSFTCSDIGTNNVTLTATDPGDPGNTNTCIAVVTVIDNLAPTAPTLAAVTVDCNGTLTAPTTTDNCAGTITGTTTGTLSFVEGSSTVITWTFDDGNGNTVDVDQTYNYDDTTAPVAPTLAAVTVDCNGTLTAPTTTDNCAGTITGTTTGTLSFVEGSSTVITWTFDDGNGNTVDVDQTYNYDDTTAPVAPTLAAVTVDCNGTLTAPTTTDNCAGTITGTTTGTLSFVEGSSTVITWTFDDGNGNTVDVDQTYNYDDTTAPVAPTLAAVTVDCNGTLTAPTTTDNCAGTITGTTTGTLSFVEGSSTVITWTFDDGNGNTVDVDQTYNYDDTTAPVAPTLAAVTVDCNGTLTAPTTTDNCAGTITGTTTGTLSFVEGSSTVITWTFDDGNGNTVDVDQTYNYDDTTAPVAPTLAAVTVDCNGTLTAPTTTDNCAGTITGTTTGTLSFVEGSSTVITWTFDDGNGNTVDVDQTYNYDDTTAPVAPTLAAVTVDCNGTLTAPTTTDNCAGTITGTTTGTLSFVEGSSTVITWTFDDGNGNTVDVDQTYNYDDTTAPVAPTLAAVTVDCNGTLTAPTTTDNCAGTITGTTTGTLSFVEGSSTVITWTFDDGNGNTVDVDQTYNYDDTTAPVAPTLAAVTVDCNGTLTAPTTTDNCAGTITGTTTGTLSFVEGSSTVITWTFDDGNGNTVDVDQTYNYDDTTAPVAPTLAAVTVDCNGTLTAPTTTDNCAGTITGTTTGTLSFVEGSSTVITWTFDDGNGNTVDVDQTYNYDDTTAPVAPTLAAVTVDCNGTLTAPTTTDNCAGTITGTTTGTLSFVEGSSTVITWTFDDGNGNTVDVDQTYNYDDTTAPVAPTLAAVTVDCNGTLTAPTTTDNCAGTITGTTTGTLSFVEGSSTVITWTFDDGNGNTVDVDQTYNYDDTTAPVAPTLAAVTVDCNGTLTAPTTTDNCAGTITGTTTGTLSFVEGSSTVITWTFDDGNGNTVDVDQTYNYDDTTAPVAPTLAAVTVDCNGTLTAPTTTDNCAGTITGTTTGTLSFVEGSSTVITWTFDDGNGNTVDVDQTYNYDDTTAPVAPTLAAVTVDCNGTLTAPTTTDNCAGTITGTTTGTLSFVEGSSTVITWTFDDGNGNTVDVDQTYNYDDTTAPVAPTLAAVTVDCNGTLTAPTTTDNCAGTITGTTTGTLSFVEGSSTVITWTFDDGNGNTVDVDQTYNYDDTTAPVAPTLAAVTVDCNGTLTAPTTTDNCAGTITGTTTGTLSFVEGSSTVITWTFDDGNGNTVDVDQTYNYDDTTAPVAPTLAAVTVDCNGTLTAPTTTDNCAGTITGTTTGTLSFVEGSSTVITWTFDDGNGNTVDVDQTYNYDDTTAPVAPTLAAVTVDCNGTLTAPTTTDNCAGTITGTTTGTLSFVEGSSTVITWTFDDGNGNTVDVDQTYNYDDTTAPVAPTLAAVTVDCNGTLTAPTTTDNCAGTITGTTTGTLSFVEGSSTVITWTFDDGNGNTVDVDQTYNYDDTTAPVAPTLAAVTVDCNGTLTAPTTTDNCAGTITGTTTGTLSFVEGSSTVITWTFDDGNGNTVDVDQTYNYDDTTAPVAPTLAAVTVDCNGTLTAPTTTDNCAGTITGTTTGTLSFVEGSSTVITWTFDDGNGNTVDVDQTYNYDDTTAPVAPTLAAVTVDCNGTLTAPTTTDNCAGTITGTTTGTLSFVEGSSTVITWTFDDGNGNTVDVDQTYNYDDTTAPVAPTLAAVTVDCNGTLTAPTTTDNCAGTITGTTTGTLSFVEGSSTVITWTFDDGNGNTVDVDQTYNYDDTTAPVAPTLAAVTVDCNGTLTAPTTTDNCAGTITGTTTGTLSFVEGSSTVITWTFDDGNGNTVDVDQTYNYDDTTAPVAPTLAAVTVDCNGTLTAPTTTDNCAGTITGTTTGTLSFVEGSSTVITWTFDDGNGNTVDVDQTYNYDDTTAPVAPTLAAVTVDCNGTLTAPTTTDNCAGTITGTTTGTLSFVEGSSTVITWTFDDGNGNTVDVDQTYNYDDTTAPVAPTLAAVTVDCNGTLTAPTTTDNCAGTITGTTTGTLSFVEGSSTVITWTFDDGNGNTVDVDQTYNYDDTTAPVAPTLAAVTVDCNGTLTAPTTTDNCAGTITGTTTGTLSFVEGSSTVITWTFDDGNGNTVDVDQTYNYDDTTAPVAPTLAAVTVDCNGTLTAPTTTDNCAGTITGTTTGTLSFVEGSSTVITWTFDDGNGNTVDVDQTYNYDDTTAPVAPTLAAVTVDCNGTLTAPTTTDNCAGTITGTTTGTLSFVEGSSTVITWTFDDGNGNTVDVDQTYNYDDTTAPVAPTLAAVTVDCNGTLTAPTTTDNCAGTITGTTTGTLSFVEGSSTVITWTFDDGNGNTVDVDQTYNYDDTTDPAIPTLSDVNVGECLGTPATPTTTDNCAGTINGTPNVTFPITAQGTTVVTWSFDDGNGNVVTADQNVIVDDTTDPVAICQNITIQLDGTGNASIVPSDIDGGSNDSCGTISLSASQTDFTTSDIGDVNVILTVDDNNGNITTCNATVTVEASTLTIDEFDIRNISITPNPFNDMINIKLPMSFNNSDFDIKIFDLNGRLVFDNQYSSINSSINVSGLNRLEQAPYLFKIINKENGASIIKRLIKF
ncbi:T9SS type A sorting domain-containing protein [Flaviramulus sp. BrNp1-15]|uniref:M14 family zinc carboxypeptidase n=1 Tax=Flaviramulus sp. BrNp1-15 TaxID=2916754 RepID=UPI001EE8ADE0|nr:M14 family zinc carboxypeptidase [Flaviramulus sp. BrNp1-15]ULC60696.1 T9SS type A sorting domain-containing protein [Flaviramulus sp. BrNp1-15]